MESNGWYKFSDVQLIICNHFKSSISNGSLAPVEWTATDKNIGFFPRWKEIQWIMQIQEIWEITEAWIRTNLKILFP